VAIRLLGGFALGFREFLVCFSLLLGGFLQALILLLG
jgi:hypothetical protein